MKYDGADYNLEYAKSATAKEFVKQHWAFYPNLSGKRKETALRAVHKFLTGADESPVTTAEADNVNSEVSESEAEQS